MKLRDLLDSTLVRISMVLGMVRSGSVVVEDASLVEPVMAGRFLIRRGTGTTDRRVDFLTTDPKPERKTLKRQYESRRSSRLYN